MPCANLELALEGAQKRQSAAVVLLLKTKLVYESRNSTGIRGVDTEQDVMVVHTSNNSAL